MESFLPTNEYKEFEGRVYQNPQLAIDEGNKFIDNLRENQLKQNQQITQQTQNLGTNVPTNLGGLTGAGSYFTSRYQVPQTNSAVADLRATAQKVGMQQALENESAMWKKRYNDAYRAYQKSAYDKENQPTTQNPSSDPASKGVVKTIIDTEREQGVSEPVGTKSFDHSSWGDFVAGKGERTISYTINGNTYYANIYNQTGYGNERFTGMDTSAGLSYEGQHALDYLNKIVADGGKIRDANGNEITPYQALTGSTGR